MKELQITFWMEPSDPEDSSGLTQPDFEKIDATLQGLGAHSIRYEMVEAEEDTAVRQPKPKKSENPQDWEDR